MASDLVRVSPQERIRRNEGESDAAVRRRWAAEQKTQDAKIAQNKSDSRWAEKRNKATDLSTKTGYDIARAVGVKFAKGGPIDGIAIRGKTRAPLKKR
jgi:hypothetical protein